MTSETADGVGFRFGYDGDGNLTSWDGGWNLSYNAQNQTTSITSGGQSQSYTYSGPDQQELLSATSSAVTIQFANSALGETYQQGTDSSFTRAFARDNRGALVSKSPSAGQYYFYLFDGLGSVAAVTDPSGNVAATYQYDPYGNVTGQTGSIYNPLQYASGWVSGVTGFSHFGARWYAPATTFTRWTQQDPVAGSLGNPTSQCRYAYASDDPVNLTDASGQISSACGWAIASALFDVVGTALLGELAIPFSLGLVAIGLTASLVESQSPLNFGLGFGSLAGAIVSAAFGWTAFGLALDVVGLVTSCA